MTRIVGNQPRDEFELDPHKSWSRIREMDRLFHGVNDPIPKGVYRASHVFFNAMDDARALAQARKLNSTQR
jgi:hypothetical protein